MYKQGDYIKVEFPDETTGLSEWMWVRVNRCDDGKRLAFGVLDSLPINEYGDKLKPGTELAVNFTQIREHKKPVHFNSETHRSKNR